MRHGGAVLRQSLISLSAASGPLFLTFALGTNPHPKQPVLRTQRLYLSVLAGCQREIAAIADELVQLGLIPMVPRAVQATRHARASEG